MVHHKMYGFFENLLNIFNVLSSDTCTHVLNTKFKLSQETTKPFFYQKYMRNNNYYYHISAFVLYLNYSCHISAIGNLTAEGSTSNRDPNLTAPVPMQGKYEKEATYNYTKTCGAYCFPKCL